MTKAGSDYWSLHLELTDEEDEGAIASCEKKKEISVDASEAAGSSDLDGVFTSKGEQRLLTGSGRSLVEHRSVSPPTTGRRGAANVALRSNRKPRAVVTRFNWRYNFLLVRSERDRQTVRPITVLFSVFWKPSPFSQCFLWALSQMEEGNVPSGVVRFTPSVTPSVRNRREPRSQSA